MAAASCLFRLVRSDGKEFVLTDKLLIGRSPECSLQIEDNLASRQHAALEVVDQKVILSDLKSHNGTWVNNQKIIIPVQLHEGDHIRLGKTIFVFRMSSVSPEAPVSAQPVASKAGETMAWGISIPLTLVRGDGAEFGLNRSMRIGRGEDNDVVLKGDTSASQAHAALEVLSGQLLITDLGSNNGTWVNGKRISERTLLRHGDKIRLGNTVFRLRVGDRPLPPTDAAAKTGSSRWPGCTALFISVMAVMLVVLGLGVPAAIRYFFPSPTPTEEASQPPAISVEATQDAARQDALLSLVEVIVPTYQGNIKDWDGKGSGGSGSLLNEQGVVMTNFHVIGDLDTGNYHNPDGLVLIALNRTNQQASPNEFYRAEVVKGDRDLDLAILRVVEIVNLETGTRNSLPADLVFMCIPLGNSDDLKPQDKIYVWGYPTVGESTPTLTDGIVSGFLFLPDNRVEWIKTNTEISEGNSGGMAINQNGELIGIPTWGRTSTSGGRINYIRPINLALELIRSACPECMAER